MPLLPGGSAAGSNHRACAGGSHPTFAGRTRKALAIEELGGLCCGAGSGRNFDLEGGVPERCDISQDPRVIEHAFQGVLDMSYGSSSSRSSNVQVAVAAAVAAGVAAAVANYLIARDTERKNPPSGKFIEVDGVKLHYRERGTGEPLVMLHGNGVSMEDLHSSGLVDLAATTHRVIVFDRPGFGHSARPRSTIWTAEAQADLFHKALRRLGVSRFLLFGHSWGACVAARLALDHPEAVGGLILASGYYYPDVRLDVIALSGPAVPVVGDAMRYTVSPLLGWLMWPSMLRKMFGPAAVPAKFAAFPKAMALRPSQLRAAAAESVLMIPAAYDASDRYGDLKMPVVIVAGEGDRIIAIDEQSAQLHADIPGSTFMRIKGAGHMVHQTATAEVMAAIKSAARGMEERRVRTPVMTPVAV
ncbi:alpha/beta hydrolase [Xanthobacter sp. KR7-65]|uniref:alpha/beta fold hydrolase n=1 Tax=Xanthobacter sp. KR7-65 TaxID=3156612 RepID=UPI0032B4731F